MLAGDTEQLTYLHDPDVQLMLRVKQGDEGAFAELVRAYQDRLVSVFHHMLHDREAAEDLAQETFFRVYRSRVTYEPTARFSTWLFRIANNLASNSRRTVHRRKEVRLERNDSGPSNGAQESLAVEKSALMPSRQFAKLELQAKVQEALKELNDRQRMALLLHKFEEMSYTDIATTMELSPAAVKSLLSRAREMLRMHLEKYVR